VLERPYGRVRDGGRSDEWHRAHVVDRGESITWFRETRRRTADLFGLLAPEA